MLIQQLVHVHHPLELVAVPWLYHSSLVYCCSQLLVWYDVPIHSEDEVIGRGLSNHGVALLTGGLNNGLCLEKALKVEELLLLSLSLLLDQLL